MCLFSGSTWLLLDLPKPPLYDIPMGCTEIAMEMYRNVYTLLISAHIYTYMYMCVIPAAKDYGSVTPTMARDCRRPPCHYCMYINSMYASMFTSCDVGVALYAFIKVHLLFCLLTLYFVVILL